MASLSDLAMVKVLILNTWTNTMRLTSVPDGLPRNAQKRHMPLAPQLL
jgi:hypothetical protein